MSLLPQCWPVTGSYLSVLPTKAPEKTSFSLYISHVILQKCLCFTCGCCWAPGSRVGRPHPRCPYCAFSPAALFVCAHERPLLHPPHSGDTPSCTRRKWDVTLRVRPHVTLAHRLTAAAVDAVEDELSLAVSCVCVSALAADERILTAVWRSAHTTARGLSCNLNKVFTSLWQAFFTSLSSPADVLSQIFNQFRFFVLKVFFFSNVFSSSNASTSVVHP